jgi:DNA-binding CsgD family transcriptional regulator
VRVVDVSALIDRVRGPVGRARPRVAPDGPGLVSAASRQVSRWDQHLGRAALGAILAAAALTLDGLVLAPGRLDIALLSVVLAVMVTARLAGFWASILTAFVAAALIDFGWFYPAVGSRANAQLDLVALVMLAVVAVLGGSAIARPRTAGSSSAGVTSAAPGELPAGPPIPSTPVQPAHTGRSADPSTIRSLSSEPEDAFAEPLTAREIEILALVASGLSNEGIAERLVVSPNTVKTHLSHVYAKLDVRSRTGAVARARAARLIELGPDIPR